MFVVPPYIQTACDLLGVVREAPLVETRVCTLAAATLFSPSETLVFSRKKWGLGQIWKAKIRVFRRTFLLIGLSTSQYIHQKSVWPEKTRRVHHEFDRLRFANNVPFRPISLKANTILFCWLRITILSIYILVHVIIIYNDNKYIYTISVTPKGRWIIVEV